MKYHIVGIRDFLIPDAYSYEDDPDTQKAMNTITAHIEGANCFDIPING